MKIIYGTVYILAITWSLQDKI